MKIAIVNSTNKSRYSEEELYNRVKSGIETDKLFNRNIKKQYALRNFRNRLSSRIDRTIHSLYLDLDIHTLKYINENFKSVNKRIKADIF